MHRALSIFLRKHFNSQPHKEADVNENWLRTGEGDFNSQPHKEADVCFVFLNPRRRYFNSQPHKEADRQSVNFLFLPKNFNSQPHKEADVPCTCLHSGQCGISTHSLTRRLTHTRHKMLLYNHISTHSLTRRLTI